MAYLLKEIKKIKRTDKQTDGQSDFIMPQILFGGIKTKISHNDADDIFKVAILYPIIPLLACRSPLTAAAAV